ncbi:MAG: HAD family hydrolase [Gammaproteobacteria bacterium]|nr:HAD family hydrolase [Gammaproteobacteria bacterium]MCF6363446.1 HAD family hydrolase [Gammaproteobacteria bacterium]
MSELKALLFDVDGTLADTEKDGHRVAFNRAFADASLDWDWTPELYGQLLAVTGGKERMRYYLSDFNREFEAPADLDAFIRSLHAAKTEHYTRLLAEGAIPLRPGVRRLLDEARGAGLRMAVVTTTTPANVEALLIHAIAPNAMGWFEVIAAGDIVPAKKPAPDIYLWAMNKMNLTPTDCIAFEDSRNGILSSCGAGVKTIITTNDYTRDDDFSDALIVLNQMGEPDQPFTVLAGDAGDAACLDLDLVRCLHSV